MLPISGISSLSKSIITVSGRDASKFLNGLVTSRFLPNVVKKKQHTISENENRHAELSQIINPETNWGLMHEDIFDPDNNIHIRRDGINSMFLNSKGRVISDCFIYSYPFHNVDESRTDELKKPKYLVETNSSSVSEIVDLLKLHKLSAKVKIRENESLHSYYYYHDSFEFDALLDVIQNTYFQTSDPQNAMKNANSFIMSDIIFNKSIANRIIGFSIDNRIPNFGIKFITDKPIVLNEKSSLEDSIPLDEIFSSSFSNKYTVNSIPEEDVVRRRYSNGLFETQDTPSDVSLLPFEINLDFTNGLSLDKGCYVGQELTIRTYNNGVIRKRVVPIQFTTPNHESVEQLYESEMIEVIPQDPVIDYIKELRQCGLTKVDITPLEDQQATVDESSTSGGHSPFGKSNSTPRKRKSSSGKLLSIKDNVGFALINLSDLEKTNLFKIELPSLDGVKVVVVKAYIPDWWS
ncbi:putative transferase CAF17, mitochondrial [Scheffersomyces amazonensis]|uniref:putative transferase CAF17, mitochondrial n=1 Tax=Scheffersomyces amazonensis TaxID=1078765 RepID=UPI00315D8A09